MKQTNNAIKFLMAQYRAIFKNANIAMVAAMAAAALAAGSANAANVDGTWDVADFDKSFSNSLKAETVTKNSSLKMSELPGDTVYTYAGADAVTKIDGAQVDITGSKDKHLAVAGLALTNKAKLSVKNTGDANTSIFGYKKGEAASSILGTLSVDGSTIEANGAGISFNYIDVNNKSTITLGGTNPGDKANIGTKSKWWVYSNLGAINSDSIKDQPNTNGVLKVTDSTVNIKHEGILVATNKIVLHGAKVNFTGQADQDGFNTAFIRASKNDIGTVELTGNTQLVTEGSADTGFGGIYSDKIDIKNASATIATGKSIILDGDWATVESGDIGNHNKATITLGNFTTSGEGKLVLGNAKTGGTVTVNGATTIGGAVENNADLTITGAGVLSVGSGSLADNTGLFHSGASATKSGTVTLANGGTLHINDTTSSASYDVGGLTFAATAAGNKIAIGASDTGNITGNFLTVSAPVTDASGLTVKANDTLTLGGASFDSSAAAVGIAAFEAKNVKLVASGTQTKYTLQDKLNLSSADTGKITGTALDVSGATVTIKAGTYTIDKDLTITKGDATSKEGLSIADGAKLVVSGGKLATVDTNGLISVNGGVLDASKASGYELKSGTITLSNAAELHLDDSKVLSGGTALSGDKFAGGSVV